MIRTVACIGISEETLLTLIETCQRKSYMLIELLIMSCFYITKILTTIAKSDICTLIIEGITGIHLDQSTLGILTIKRALWTTKHIYPTQLVIVEIKSRLTHHRNTIEIKTNSRTIDSASYSSDINRGRKTATIIWHYKIRNKPGKIT